MLDAATDANRSSSHPSNRFSFLRSRPSWDGSSLAFYSLERSSEESKTTIVFEVVLEDRRTGSVKRIEAQRLTVLAARVGRAVELTSHERNVLARIGFYLEAGQRRRLRPELVVGHVGEDAELWPALVAGERTLVAHAVDDGEIAYEVLANDAELATARALTATEARVLAQAVGGTTGKEIAIDLGLSASAVSLALANAAAKMGAMSTTELLRLGARLAPRPACAVTATLTAAEQDVLDLVRRGLRNGEIAELRGRSARTVANQVASILRKTGRPSRRALLVSGQSGRR